MPEPTMPRNSLHASVIEAAARAAHEVNRAYCIALGDISQAPWESAPDWQQSSARNGVIGVLVRGNGPRESHESWLKEKRENGWSWGPEKDATLRRHPCFVPYDDLPEAQRRKDDLFIGTVRAVAAALAVG